MKLPKESVLLRVFIGEDEKRGGKPAYEAIVLKAREMKMAGATVLRGIMGYGHNTRQVHTAKFFEITNNLPVVVEIVDTKKNINNFLKKAAGVLSGGLITVEKAVVIHYGKRN
jgi:PII-like signaling protein